MERVNESWRKIVELLQVPNHPGLYVLGCFARRVTIFSQQVRAINLVDAIAGLGYLAPASRVAVVGAGFGGTTASAALTNLGVNVTLYDSQTAAMHLQLNCETRYIHPHIYDWPSKDISDTNAGLPILNWHADSSKAVAKQVQDAWNEICQGKVELRFGRQVVSVTPEQRRWKVETKAGDVETFDHVILAVGFGFERTSPFSTLYWGDLPLAAVPTQQQKWLVSGAGDGALTDVMRLCVQHTDHGNTLRQVVEALKTIDHQALRRLRDKAAEHDYGDELFDSIDAHAVSQNLKLSATPVTLNASRDEVFGTSSLPPRASLLNRLIAWLLSERQVLVFKEGWLKQESVQRTEGNYTVYLGDPPAPATYEQILLRHGPDPAIFSKELAIGVAPPLIDSLKRKWTELYEEKKPDPTLERDWPRGFLSRQRLAPNFKNYPAMLLFSEKKYNAEEDLDPLKNAIDSIIRSSSIQVHLRGMLGHQMPDNEDIPSLAFEAAVSTPRMFSYAVQCLSRAPILIVDGGTITPSLALLLGIRAAVRRGITLIYHAGNMDEQAWQKLPFNLREIRIVEVGDEFGTDYFEQPVAAVLEEGLRRFNTHPGQYSDLPGFDALRNLGWHKDDVSPKAGVNEILVLCPFDSEYKRNCWPEIQRAALNHFGQTGKGGTPAQRVIDLAAPETLARRLYEAIRLDEECIADLSLGRPNVYFELGVRLATHPRGARAIHCLDLKTEDDLDQDSYLLELLGSAPYHTKAKATPRVKDALSFHNGTLACASSSGFVFNIVERSIEPQQEAGGTSMLDFLWNTVAAVAGSDLAQLATLPVLYSNNIEVRANALSFIVDGLIAYILLTRHSNQSRAESRYATAIDNLEHLQNEASLPVGTRDKIKILLKTEETL